MLFAVIFSAMLLCALLFWCKQNFLVPPKEKKLEKFKGQDIILVGIVSFAFVGAQYLIIVSFTEKQTSFSMNSYLDPDQQFKIGRAFYLGKELPKDNAQALSWLILASENGSQEAKELLSLLGQDAGSQNLSLPEGTNLNADVISPNHIKTKLKDIAGLNQAKADIQQFLELIKNPTKYEKIGAKAPKGIILYGPPGTGKTLLARAIAGEAQATFIAISGAAFEENYVGTGAARVRELFNLARKHKPAIIFIDEIDALAPARSTESISISHIQTVNQLLSEMENIDSEKNKGIYVLAATNRLDAMDNALLRPGRFDWQFHIRLPSDQDRHEILTAALKQIVFDNINVDDLVEKTAGYSMADIYNLVNEAALFAAKEGKKAVELSDFELALKKIATYDKALSPTLDIAVLSSTEVKTKFSDIAGMNEAKKEVSEIVDFLKNTSKFTRLGAKPPSGILIYGPPGTGKTLMARGIAGESNANFISVSGSSFNERYVGVGAARVRELFKLARQYKPCIVFIDEIDALASTRQANDTSGNDQTLNQFLNEMDNIQSNINEGIIFIGATNRIDIIDPAVLRPGRFDRKVYFRLPTLQERQAILNVHIKKIQISKDVDVLKIAQTTVGFSGADLANLVNEAAIEATRLGKNAVDMASFEEANDKITLGVNQGSGSFSEKERKLTAYHEAGHALVGLLHPNQPKSFHKMTIGLRGSSMGVTHFKSETENYSWNKLQLESLIATSLGGYIAEELIFGKDNVTTGASSDFINANQIAKDMVTKYAMADEQSLIVDEVLQQSGDFVARNVEIILKRDYDFARNLIEKNIDKLHLLAKALLENETLDYDQITTILKLPFKQ
ncbi:MAG: AAA family ATPase [Proteobacteria bacterium]|nr:AAA family ATPase [Pseudomonadota bacterium]